MLTISFFDLKRPSGIFVRRVSYTETIGSFIFACWSFSERLATAAASISAWASNALENFDEARRMRLSFSHSSFCPLER